jgi:hypothetical protein
MREYVHKVRKVGLNDRRGIIHTTNIIFVALDIACGSV